MNIEFVKKQEKSESWVVKDKEKY